MHGHIVPLAVAAVHFLVIDPFDATVAVRRDGNGAFGAALLDDLRLEDAPRDTVWMLELVFAMVVGHRLVFPERRRAETGDVLPDVLMRPRLLV